MQNIKRIGGGFFVAFFILMSFGPSSASAHSILESSFPTASSLLAESPREVKLDFNEHVEATLGNIELFDQKQHAIKIGKAVRSRADLSVVTAKIPSLHDGVYVVVWRVVSADGHPVSGAFPFEIGTSSSGTADELLQKVVNGVRATSDLGNPLAAMRFLAFLAVIVLLGSLSLVGKSDIVVSPAAQKIARTSIVGLILSSFAILLLQGPFVSGRSWGAISDIAVLSDVVTTRLGVWLLMRILCGALWGVLFVLAGSYGRPWWRRSTLVLSVLTLLSFASSGHPSAGTFPAVFVTLDVVHFAAISVWVGALVAMVYFSRSVNTEEVARTFSRRATWAMPLTIVTGVVQALHLTGGLGGIFDSEYGKLLAAKSLAVIVIVLLGASARKKLSETGSASIAKVIRTESAIVVVVLALTALMVAKAPEAVSTRIPSSFSAALTQGNVFTELQVVPAVVGPAEVHVILTPPGGTLTPVVNVQVRFELPSRNIPPIPVTMIPIGPNHWSGVIQFPYAGKWDMEARVEPKKNQTLLFTTEVLVTD